MTILVVYLKRSEAIWITPLQADTLDQKATGSRETEKVNARVVFSLLSIQVLTRVPQTEAQAQNDKLVSNKNLVWQSLLVCREGLEIRNFTPNQQVQL